jgi:ABC-type nitrate/sulfonate/bicarbonate transport system ATPase subunit
VTNSSPAGKKSIIEIEHLDFTYTEGQKVIEDFNLSIYDQELITIVGASGCGKSTLLNIIAGLLPPTHGLARIKGQEITQPGPDRTMVFQDDAVFPWYTVRQNVEYGLRVQKVPKHERDKLVDYYINLVGLNEAMDLFPRQLSGGMRKRVDVARAIATKPEVLLMDEPFADQAKIAGRISKYLERKPGDGRLCHPRPRRGALPFRPGCSYDAEPGKSAGAGRGAIRPPTRCGY